MYLIFLQHFHILSSGGLTKIKRIALITRQPPADRRWHCDFEISALAAIERFEIMAAVLWHFNTFNCTHTYAHMQICMLCQELSPKPFKICISVEVTKFLRLLIAVAVLINPLLNYYSTTQFYYGIQPDSTKISAYIN